MITIVYCFLVRDIIQILTLKSCLIFAISFIGSDEELSSLKQAYLSSKGDMQKIIDSVMCATMDDEERFREILLPLIKSKELPSYKKFTDESKTSKAKRQSKVRICLNHIL